MQTFIEIKRFLARVMVSYTNAINKFWWTARAAMQGKRQNPISKVASFFGG